MYENTEPVPSRRLWDLDCTAITMMLVHGVPMPVLRRCARACVCRCCAHLLEDDAWVLQGAHKACHGRNEISEELEAYLNQAHLGDVIEVRSSSLLATARRLSQKGPATGTNLGVLWALLTDANTEKRNLGQRMVHALILRGAHAAFPAVENGMPLQRSKPPRAGHPGALN